MKHCKYCNIDVNTERKTCPLCLNVLESDNQKSNLQNYPKKQPKRKMSFWIKSALFMSLITILVSFVVNYLTFSSYSNYWSILVAVSIPYLWLIVSYVIIGRGLLTTRVLSAGIATTILVILIELTVCFINKIDDRELYWSINYVLPFMIMATMIALIIICIVRKDLYKDSIIMFFLMALLSLLGFLLRTFTSLIVIDWPTIACSVAGLALVIGLFVFTFKDIVEEIQKRFHI